jgi:hypothetical protein
LVDGNVEVVEEAVAEVLGGQAVERGVVEEGSGRGGHVVAVFVAGMEEGGGGGPVGLVQESWVKFGDECLPPLLRCCVFGGQPIFDGFDVAQVVLGCAVTRSGPMRSPDSTRWLGS